MTAASRNTAPSTVAICCAIKLNVYCQSMVPGFALILFQSDQLEVPVLVILVNPFVSPYALQI